MFGMRRREFITLLGATATWPFSARAQQTMPVIGFLGVSSPDSYAPRLVAFHQGLNESGYVEGQNAIIEYRWANDRYDQLSELAVDLVRRKVTVIAIGGGGAAAFAAKAATSTIPIVFATGGDPIELGLVASLTRPAGNITGVSFLTSTLVAKQFEVLHEIVPNAGVVGILVNPANPLAKIEIRNVQAAADSLGQKLLVVEVAAESELERAFTTFVQQRVGALLVLPDVVFYGRRNPIVAAAARHLIPAIYPSREFAAAGGLVSYGTSIDDAYRLVGVYVGRILKGEKPADLPVQQSVKVELVINFKTARMLGISIPLPLSGRADEVIE
jgi:putative ABC transport system substrate-binding protein